MVLIWMPSTASVPFLPLLGNGADVAVIVAARLGGEARNVTPARLIEVRRIAAEGHANTDPTPLPRGASNS
jgi:hypothetical protein